MRTTAKVAVVKVDDHSTLDKAIATALDLIGAKETIGPEETILLKPNLLMKIKNACTESDFLAGVARYLKQYNPNLQLGDSPGQFRSRGKSVLKAVGLDTVMEAENIEYTEFEAGGVLMDNPGAHHMRTYHIARSVIQADLLVNLCRPKSHVEAVYTGAIKNNWGIIPGGEKAHCHLFGKNPVEFGRVLVDNYQTLCNEKKKRLTVMDARRFMEGPGGPANGFMRQTGLILAGYDEVAVDLVILAIARIDGMKAVPHLKACRERGLGPSSIKAIEIRGNSIEEVRLKRKIRLPSHLMSGVVSLFTGKIAYRVMRRMPALKKEDNCVMCGDCYNICPNRAISWAKKEKPVFHHGRCISCLCCVECCPQQTLEARAAGLAGLFLKYPEIDPERPPQPRQ